MLSLYAYFSIKPSRKLFKILIAPCYQRKHKVKQAFLFGLADKARLFIVEKLTHMEQPRNQRASNKLMRSYFLTLN